MFVYLQHTNTRAFYNEEHKVKKSLHLFFLLAELELDLKFWFLS